MVASRAEALRRNRAFQNVYRVALDQWHAKLPAVFLPGKYKTRGQPNVVILE